MKLFYIDPQSYNNLAVYDTSLLQNISDTDIVFFCNVKYQCQRIGGIDYRSVFNYSDKHGIKKLFSYIFSILKICMAVIEERPDVVHIQWFRFFYVDSLLVSLLRLLKIKVIHTAHNVLPHIHTSKDIKQYSWYYRHSDAIIVHTKRSKDELSEQFSIAEDKIHIIPHGLLESTANKDDVQKRVSEIKEQLALHGKMVFGVLGNQNYYKGIDIITEVWNTTPELNSNNGIKLLVVGRVENADLTNLKKYDNVYIKSEIVSDTDFDAYLEASSTLLLPYRTISQSGVLLTALQREKSVVVTDVGGLTDPLQIAQVGWNIGKPNVENLRSMLLSISSHPQEIANINHNVDIYSKIKSHYSWTTIGNATTALYKSLITIFIILLYCLSYTIPSKADSVRNHRQLDSIKYNTITGINIPVLHIETENQVDPTCEAAYPPEGQGGQSIKNATKVPGRLIITLLKDTLYDSNEFVSKKSGMKIKIRGNTSSSNADKPCYKIKLEKKADLLFQGDNNYADTEWLLLKERNLKMKEGFMVNELLGMPWTPKYRYVNVIMNGIYRGWYVLCESVKRNQKCRIDVEKNGYIFEYDVYWWNEKFYLPSSRFRFNYTLKYPDEDDITEEQAQKLQEIINKFETDIWATDSAANSIDLTSFATWMLGQDIMGNSDGAGSNMFLMKKDDTPNSKIQMVTLWDFDGAEDMVDTLSNSNGNHLWWPLVHYQPDFVKEYVRLWDKVSPTLFDNIINRFEEYGKSQEAEALDSTRQLKKWVNQWPDTCSVAKDIERVTSWLTRRKVFLTQAIDSLYRDINSGIEEVKFLPTDRPLRTDYMGEKLFDITGCRIGNNHYQGFIIICDNQGRRRKFSNFKRSNH